MRRFLYLLTASVYTGAVFMAGMLVSQLYAVYVLMYTGAVFMVGLWVGQRWERSWAAHRNAQAASASEESPEALADTDVRKHSELTSR